MTIDPRLEAARLLDTDEEIGVHAWPLACYVSEAIENELSALTPQQFERGQDYRFRLSVRRAANNAASYAEQYGIEPTVFRAAVETRRI